MAVCGVAGRQFQRRVWCVEKVWYEMQRTILRGRFFAFQSLSLWLVTALSRVCAFHCHRRSRAEPLKTPEHCVKSSNSNNPCQFQ